MCTNMYLRALYGHVHTPTCVFMHVRTRAVSWVCLARRWGLPALDTSDRWQLSPATWIQPSPWGGNWQSEAEPTAERGHWLWGQGRSGGGGVLGSQRTAAEALRSSWSPSSAPYPFGSGKVENIIPPILQIACSLNVCLCWVEWGGQSQTHPSLSPGCLDVEGGGRASLPLRIIFRKAGIVPAPGSHSDFKFLGERTSYVPPPVWGQRGRKPSPSSLAEGWSPPLAGPVTQVSSGEAARAGGEPGPAEAPLSRPDGCRLRREGLPIPPVSVLAQVPHAALAQPGRQVLFAEEASEGAFFKMYIASPLHWPPHPPTQGPAGPSVSHLCTAQGPAGTQEGDLGSEDFFMASPFL